MKRTHFTQLLLLVLLTLTACNLPAATQNVIFPTPVAISGNLPYITADPNATVTPTPFLPEGATPLPTLPPATPTEDPFAPTPTEIPLIDRLDRPAGQVNILILGNDYRPGSGYRTDVMMLVSLNPNKGTASVISFPRDLYVFIPGWQQQRINTAQQHGGFETTAATFEYNFGIPVDHYIMTNMNGFVGIVNTLGGINVTSSKELYDRCDLPQAVDKYCYIGVGTYPMDGQTALWYVRSRYSTSDFDRTRRAQEVVQAMFLKLLNLNAVQRAPELWNLFSSSVETDMALSDITPLLPLANTLSDTSRVTRYSVNQDFVTSYRTEGGAAVLLPNTDLIWNNIVVPAIYEQ